MVKRKRLPVDPIDSAAVAGLHYVCDVTPGYKRRRAGRGFCFLDTHGRTLRDAGQLKRIRSLAIPPAWKNVWICPSANGHLQALGYDARGRRQYRYHPKYREIRDQTKFDRIPDFARCLPAIRNHVAEDLARTGLPREKVLATVVRLLETTFIRVGNSEYARENESFGLTTLRNRHVSIEGSTIRFRFRGKSGLNHEVEVRDRRLARIIRTCHDLPGYDLFEYLDDDGVVRTIGSGDVNSYLMAITGQKFTAKDFRTWAGTVQTALQLAMIGPFGSVTEGKRNIVAAIKATAQRLGNRPATCRNYYVHPAVVESYLDGTLLHIVRPPSSGEAPDSLGLHPEMHPEEACVLRLLRAHTGASLKAA
jgi:DNA topoisomerase-1